MAPRQTERQEAPKKDWKDYLIEGLQIANGIAGLASNVQTVREKQGNIEAQNREAQGILSGQRLLEAQKAGMDVSYEPSQGAMPYSTVGKEGDIRDVFIRQNAIRDSKPKDIIYGIGPKGEKTAITWDRQSELPAGFKPWVEPKQQELTTIETTDEKGNPVIKVVPKISGSTYPKPIKENQDKQPTEAQMSSANFGRKAQDANSVIQKIEDSGYDPSAYGRAARDLPLLGSFTKSDADRGYEQAQKEFIAAILRKESGGAITKDEFSEYGKIYFPQPGDGPEVLTQKAIARDKAAKSLLEMAGEKAAGSISNRDISGLRVKQQSGMGEAIAAPKTPAKAKQIMQNGVIYKLNERTGQYE